LALVVLTVLPSIKVGDNDSTFTDIRLLSRPWLNSPPRTADFLPVP
jgi:hypothetical protein